MQQITMLKFIKNLSMLTATLETLQNANAIEVLTDLLEASRHGSHFRVGLPHCPYMQLVIDKAR